MEYFTIGNKIFNNSLINEMIMKYTTDIKKFSQINHCSYFNSKKIRKITKKYYETVKIIKKTNNSIHNLYKIFLRQKNIDDDHISWDYFNIFYTNQIEDEFYEIYLIKCHLEESNTYLLKKIEKYITILRKHEMYNLIDSLTNKILLFI